jgi:hypothetical protein
MFLLPSGVVNRTEGQDNEHPIVLKGYKKDEISCLLRVMYPRYALSPILPLGFLANAFLEELNL